MAKKTTREAALRAKAAGRLNTYPSSDQGNTASRKKGKASSLPAWFPSFLASTLVPLVNAEYSIRVIAPNCGRVIGDVFSGLVQQCFSTVGVYQNTLIEGDIQQWRLEGTAIGQMTPQANLSYTQFIQEHFPYVLGNVLEGVENAFCNDNNQCEVPLPDSLNTQVNVKVSHLIPQVCTQFQQAMIQKGLEFHQALDTTQMTEATTQLYTTLMSTLSPNVSTTTSNISSTTDGSSHPDTNSGPAIPPILIAASVVAALALMGVLYKTAAHYLPAPAPTSLLGRIREYLFPTPPRQTSALNSVSVNSSPGESPHIYDSLHFSESSTPYNSLRPSAAAIRRNSEEIIYDDDPNYMPMHRRDSYSENAEEYPQAQTIKFNGRRVDYPLRSDSEISGTDTDGAFLRNSEALRTESNTDTLFKERPVEDDERGVGYVSVSPARSSYSESEERSVYSDEPGEELEYDTAIYPRSGHAVRPSNESYFEDDDPISVAYPGGESEADEGAIKTSSSTDEPSSPKPSPRSSRA